jgi:hypothetical protein
MYDHLPKSALPSRPELAEDLLEAKAKAKALFKELPESEEKTSVLQALGRLGTLTLRRKIAHRAAIVNGRIAPKLQHLDLVVSEAVNMRNHYVHGSPLSFDREVFPGAGSFLTEALEFLFIVSDLIDAGWNVQEWYIRVTSRSHPLKALVKDWDEEASRLWAAKETGKGFLKRSGMVAGSAD